MSRSQSKRYEEQRRRIDQQETPQPGAEQDSRDQSVERGPLDEPPAPYQPRRPPQDYVSVQDRLHPYSPPRPEAYRASKTALDMYMVLDSRDHRDQGLRVFGMCPGFVVSNLRGPGEEARTGRGMAGDPREAGELLLSIIRGERDADEGRVVHKDGVYPW